MVGIWNFIDTCMCTYQSASRLLGINVKTVPIVYAHKIVSEYDQEIPQSQTTD